MPVVSCVRASRGGLYESDVVTSIDSDWLVEWTSLRAHVSLRTPTQINVADLSGRQLHEANDPDPEYFLCKVLIPYGIKCRTGHIG